MDRVSLLRIGNRKLTNDTMSGNKSLLLQDVSQKYCAKSQIQIAKYDKNIQWAILPGFLLVKLSLYKYMYARTHVSIFGSLTSLKKFITTGS